MHLTGSLFRKFRERKGVSVPEAAKEIVSPQFLRKYERGDNDVSLTNFLNLLYKENISVVEFFGEYHELTVDVVLDEAEREFDLVINGHRSLLAQKISQKYHKIYQETQDQKFLYLALTCEQISYVLFKNRPEVDRSPISEYLRSVEEWGRFEFFIAQYSMFPLEDEEIYRMTVHIFRKKAQNTVNYYYLHDFFLQVCLEFIRREELIYAEEILNLYLSKLEDDRELKYMPFDSFARFLGGIILVKRNDPKGKKLCEAVITYFEDVLGYTYYANRLNLSYTAFLEKSELS
ncbi:helix-turn-helix domain-containing protein [Enterococcus sp. LJL128]|uniref:helix-turn-helix domain-containing protein n=1 Tax=Enterococcus sp. LJL51 TaxID=3416656 RepID=UPI003CF67170